MPRPRSPTPKAREAAPLIAQVFAKLADGKFHSGEELARDLKVSRSAVWKATGALRELGSTLHAVRNRGYRLAHPAEPLDEKKIRARLEREVRERVRRDRDRLVARLHQLGAAGAPQSPRRLGRGAAGRVPERRPRPPRAHAGSPLRAGRSAFP